MNARHHASTRGSERLQGLFGLEASSGIEEDTLSRFARAAEDEGAPTYVVLEDEGEEANLVQGLDGASVWSRGGAVLHRGPIAVEDEVVFREREVWITHGAQSDILSGMGAMDLARAASSGLRLALGTCCQRAPAGARGLNFQVSVKTPPVPRDENPPKI